MDTVDLEQNNATLAALHIHSAGATANLTNVSIQKNTVIFYLLTFFSTKIRVQVPSFPIPLSIIGNMLFLLKTTEALVAKTLPLILSIAVSITIRMI